MMKVRLVWLKWISLVIGNISFVAWIYSLFTRSFTSSLEAGVPMALLAGYFVFATIIPLNLHLFSLRWLNWMGFTAKLDTEGTWTADKPGRSVGGVRSVEALYDWIYATSDTVSE